MKTIWKTFGSVVAAAAISFSATIPVTADDLESVSAEGVIRIAMTGQYPPFNFVNTENQVVGFDPSIGMEIASRMGVEAEIVTTAWDGIIAGLLSNRYDAIVGSMTITAERSEVVDFVGPYYRTSRAIFASEGSEITSVNQLDGQLVGVGLGETHEEWAREQGYNVRTYRGLTEMLIELDNGRVDVIIADLIAGSLAAREGGQAVQVLTDLDTPVEEIGIAVRQGNPELLAAMQAALDDMMEDGAYLAIAEEWIGRDIR